MTEELFNKAKTIVGNAFEKDYDRFLELAGCTSCSEFKNCNDDKDYIPVCRWRSAVRNVYNDLLEKQGEE